MSDLTTTEFEQLVALEEMLADLSIEARRIADESGLSRRAIAERMGHSSASTVQRLVGGAAYNSTVETLSRFAWACGYQFKLELVPKAVVHKVPKARALPTLAKIPTFESYRKARPGGWKSATTGVRTSPSDAPGADIPSRRTGSNQLAA